MTVFYRSNKKIRTIEITSIDELVTHAKKASKHFKRPTKKVLSEFELVLTKNVYNGTITDFIKSILPIKKLITNREILKEYFGWTDSEVDSHLEKVKTRNLRKFLNQGLSEEEAKKELSKEARRNSNLCIEFWTSRGYSEDEAKEKISEIQKLNNKKAYEKHPNLNREISPRCVEYWIKKGYSVSEAKSKVSEWQREKSPRCIEYWLKKGYSYDIAIEKLSEWQANRILNLPEEKRTNLYANRFNYDYSKLPNVNGYFYIIKLDENHIKIGVTIKDDINLRYSADLLKDKVILEFNKMKNLKEALDLEQALKLYFLENKKICISNKDKFKGFGWTEILTNVTYNELKELINEIN